MTEFVTLDVFDRKLLERARRNNLEPARVTAEAVGLSESAVLRRLRRLRAEGVIVADVAVVDPARAVPSMPAYEAFSIREFTPEAGVRTFKSMIVIREVVGFDPGRAMLER